MATRLTPDIGAHTAIAVLEDLGAGTTAWR